MSEHNKKKIHLTTNKRVRIRNDLTAAIFPRQLLDVNNDTVPTKPYIEIANLFSEFASHSGCYCELSMDRLC